MRRISTLLAAGLAFGGAAAVAAPSAAATVPSCTYSYVVASQWTGGFSAELAVSYMLSAPSSGWTIGFDFVSPGQHVIAGWNESIVQSGEHVVVTPGSAVSVVIPQSGTIVVGFVASYTTSNPPPVNVTFDGIPCSAAVS